MPAALIAGAVIGAVVKGKASKDAANAQQQAANSAISEQQRQYDQTRQDQLPYTTAGAQAVNNLANPQTAFQTSPGYNFRVSEGQRDLGNSFAARGGAFSGNALKALTQYNQNMASNEYGNWWNQQAGLAGIGQAATQNVANAGATAAGNTGNALMYAGNARASGILGAGDAVAGLGYDLVGLNQLGLLKRQSGVKKQGPWGWSSPYEY